MTIGANSVNTTKTYGKIAPGRGPYNKRVKPVITSQAMLQNKGCHLEGCVHEYSGVIRQFSIFKSVTLPEPSFFMLDLGRKGSSWDEMGMCCDNVKPAE